MHDHQSGAAIRTVSREFEFSSNIEAPREQVWRAWSERGPLEKWWGPKGLETRINKLEFKPGGVFHYSMTAPDGETMWGKFVFREIEVPFRLVYVSSFSDPEGNVARAPFSDLFPKETLNVVTLDEEGTGTRLLLRSGPINETKEEHEFFVSLFESMHQGFGGTFEQLREFLASETK